METVHNTHKLRFSDASSFDNVCIYCNKTDISGAGWGELSKPCLGAKPILEHKYDFNKMGVNVSTIKEYLQLLLYTLWSEGEGFSGKRPFGNSGWEYDLYSALISYDDSFGSFDEDGYVQDVDKKLCNRVIFECIDYLFRNGV